MYSYDPTGHELYDELTRHLFSRLHGWSDHKILFAQRGHKPRTKVFVDAIAHESEGFARDCRRSITTCGPCSASMSGGRPDT